MGSIEDMQERFREMLARWDADPGQTGDTDPDERSAQ